MIGAGYSMLKKVILKRFQLCENLCRKGPVHSLALIRTLRAPALGRIAR